MPVIDPEGLFDGERLAACSDKAKIFWPYIYCSTNGYARIELNPRQIRQRCFASFTDTPSEQDIMSVLQEYAENYLLLVYEHEGREWGQFDTDAKYLPRHKSKKDDASPSPTEDEKTAFQEGYVEWKKAKSFTLQQTRKFSEKFAEMRKNVRGIGIGVGVGFGTGVGTGDAASPVSQSDLEETDMKAKDEMQAICLSVLGLKAEGFDSMWAEVKTLEKAFGGTSVVNTFREWAEENAGETFQGKPVSAFLRIAPGLLHGTFSASKNPQVSDLAFELAYASDNEVTFNDQQKGGLGKLLKEFTCDEVLLAFKEFFQKLDRENAFKMRNAASDFIQTADQFIRVARRNKQDKEREEAAVEATRQRMVARAEEERRLIAQKKAEEDALVVDELTAD
jgi:hypothetical protein